MKNYDHNKIEKKWQKFWAINNTYKTELNSKKKKMYVLDMFPYPSGVGLHVGHPRGYIGSDVYARMKRMQGYNVLHPMGYDAFGLPAEQYALQHKIHPRVAVEKNVKTFENQLSKIGLSYDWSLKINTTDPKYYKWTQWIFLEIYNSWFDLNNNKARKIKELVNIFNKSGNFNLNAYSNNHIETFSSNEWRSFNSLKKQEILMKYRLAYEGYSEVNWCQELGTVLANDEITYDSNGNAISERGNYKVEKKIMRQWFMRITAYADRLLSELDNLLWSEHIKEIQRNWIGKSEGVEIDFDIVDDKNTIKVFTTRVDTILGVSYIVLSPEHVLIEKLKEKIQNKKEVENYILKAKKIINSKTSSTKEKTGVELVGIKAINKADGNIISIWVSDYVLNNYGTGAIMAVPEHDERDKQFAIKYNIPILKKDLVDKNDIIRKVGGKIVNKYKMRDAIFARQRYWGEPIPLIHDDNGIIREVDKNDLPLELPKIKSYELSGNGESPLSLIKSWKKEGYETNTMPGWAGSSWYFFRYMDPNNELNFASSKRLKYWKDVDVYIGGQEHSTGHLLYSRFFTHVLFDLGHISIKEPFKRLVNQGMILGSDSRKMSKRWGNVINPDEIVDNYGADTLRIYEMFMGPFGQSLPWSTESIIGSRRFIDRVYRVKNNVNNIQTELKLKKEIHKTIKKIEEDIESFSFNTAISSLMILLNEIEKYQNINIDDFKLFIKILSPFAPHITEEIWHELGEVNSINTSKWPKYDNRLIVDENIKIMIQVNGKVRSSIFIKNNEDEEVVKSLALESKNVLNWLENKDIKRIIYVKNRLINIVI